MKLANNPRARRGVLLLVVLGMLAMFGLIGITFVILTSHERRGAEACRRVEQYADPADDLLHQAMLQALRGTNNPASALRPHGLLEDLYGSETLGPFASSGAVAAVQGGQLTNLVIDTSTPLSLTNAVRTVGRVLTMQNGPAKGQSVRIVGYGQSGPATYLQVTAFEGTQALAAGSEVTVNTLALNVANGSQFIINGTPFSGTGFGYNQNATGTNPWLTATDPDSRPYALTPNPVGFVANGSYTDPSGPGGANEDYDAPDYQNMLLAMQVPEEYTAGGAGFSYTVPAGATPIPSLHRPALVNYWFRQLDSILAGSTEWGSLNLQQKKYVFREPYGIDGKRNTGDETLSVDDVDKVVALKSRILLRPLTEYHPNFTGSNTAFHPLWDGVTPMDTDPTTYDRWDVDNDGDGVEDSIWVDLGMPVRSTKDGRLYKPLFAVHCVDMDGRLNLNAHGCLAQAYGPFDLNGDSTPETNYADPVRLPYPYPSTPCFAGLNTTATLVRGQGWGPAEINLGPLFSNVTQYKRLLCGYKTSATDFLDGRYGESANYNSVTTPPVSGWTRRFVSGLPNTSTEDPLSQNSLADYPGFPDWVNYISSPKSYGTPPDLKGTLAIGLDLRGQPLYSMLPDPACQAETADPSAMMNIDHPYQLDLSRDKPRGLASSAPRDNLFSPAELERVLRPYDTDAAMLPHRINTLAPSLLGDGTPAHPSHRHEVTTESWSLPCPSVALTPERRDMSTTLPNKKASHVVDLLRAANVPDGKLQELVSWDLLAGRKMDLNRPFGNGLDDNGNGVVDEAGIIKNLITPDGEKFRLDPADNGEEIAEQTPQFGSTGALTAGSRFNRCNQIDVNNDRQVNEADFAMARQLYARHLYVQMLMLMNYHVANATAPSDEEKAEARTAAQWAVNVVDFRDRDAIMTPFEYDLNPFDGWDVDGVVGSIDDNQVNRRGLVWGCERPELLITETLAFHDRRTQDLDTDGDQDQKVMPQGSLFVELYNPWTSNEPLPAELYASGGVQLQRVNVNADPVWRMIIAPGGEYDQDPDDPDDTVTIERTIYFDPAGGGPADGDVVFRPAAAGDVGGVITPGRYAVIGPGGVTYLGRRSDGQPQTAARQIELDPGSNTVSVARNRDTSDSSNEIPVTSIQPPIAIAIDSPQRLSISEPDGGYPPHDSPDGLSYMVVKEDPLDTDAELAASQATIPRHKVIHLQRLANPLAAYDAKTNPYLTIDSMPIDFTPFNGYDGTVNSGTKMLATNERGDGDKSLWRTVLDPAKSLDASDTESPAAHHFPHILEHTLGYLNRDYHFNPGNPASPPGWSSADGVPVAYYGSPKSPTDPFPWMTWNNRPFVSEMELALVPRWRSSRLLQNFGINSGGNPYDNNPANDPFGNLINFFRDQDVFTATPNWKLHRLLQFVHVPSRFVGTELQGTPASFASGNHAFHPPFNRISNYREPGRVNINTIASENVWRGLMNYGANPTWANLVASRRGGVGTDLFSLVSDVPTRFANPFRSFAGRYLVPDTTPSNPANKLQTLIGNEVNATLLRRSAIPAGSNSPLFEQTLSMPYNNTSRNPYFRYQILQRLGNLVTTRSNVYAMWITVGNFEVEALPTGFNPAIYPDGYRLGQELGSDTGEIERHRAFYLIDRSIPVGFQRGRDLNVEKAVLLKRFIE